MADQITDFGQVIDLWKERRQFAEDVSYFAYRPVSMAMVRTWRSRKSIPVEYLDAVALAARRRRISGVTQKLLSDLFKARYRQSKP